MSQTKDYSCSEVTDIQISKAKKREGFYICPVTSSSSRSPFIVCLNGATIIDVKETSHTVVMKCKGMTHYMDSLNDIILDVVRENSSSWFSTRIDDDLIDEYYISTLQYDKKKGETIRIKIKNIEEIEEQFQDCKINIVLSLKYIKFYKQKFFPEFELQLIEHSVYQSEKCALEFLETSDEEGGFSSDEEEVPLPSYEEIHAMKTECIEKLYDSKSVFEDSYTSIAKKLTKVGDAIHKLETCNDFSTIIRLCEEYQNISCD